MKIRELHIYGFGKWQNRSFLLDGPLALFYGPNEAGKSTLLGFVRSMLFGFPNRNHPERYEPAEGGRHGGVIVLEDEEGRRIRVERLTASQGGRRKSAGMVRVFHEDGTEGDEEDLKQLLGGLSPDLFRNLFAFGLGELQEIGTLHSNEISGYLYSAGMGAQGPAIVAAEQALLDEMDKLYLPKGNRVINRMAGELEELHAKMRKSKEQSFRYSEWQEKLERLNAQIELVEGELRAQREALSWAEVCVQGRGSWVRMKEIERELEELSEFVHFPEDGLQRFESLVRERDHLAAELSSKERKIGQAQVQWEALSVDETLLRQKEDIYRLAERLPLVQEGQAQIAELGAEIRQLDEQLRHLVKQIGGDWTAETLAQFPISVSEREKVRQFRERFDVLARERERLVAERDRLLQERSLYVKRMEELDSAIRDLEKEGSLRLPFSVRDAEELEGHLRQIEREMGAVKEGEGRLRHLLERREDAEKNRAVLEMAFKNEAEREMALQKRRWALGGLAGLFFVVLSWIAVPDKPWIAGLCTVLFLVFAAGYWMRLRSPRKREGFFAEKANGFPAVELDRRLEEIEGEIRQQEQELARRKRMLNDRFALLIGSQEAAASAEGRPAFSPDWAGGEPSLPGEPSLRFADKLLEEWREALRLRANLDARKRELERKREELEEERSALDERLTRHNRGLEQVKTEHSDLEREWNDWLVSRRLQENLSPEIVQDIFRLAEQGNQLLERRNRANEKLNTLTDQQHTFEREARQVLGDRAFDDLSAALKSLKEKVDGESGRLAKKMELEKQRREWEEEAVQLKERLVLAEQRIRSLWQEGRAQDEETFRLNASRHLRAKRLQEEFRQLSAEIETWIGRHRQERFFAEMEEKDRTRLEQEIGERKRRIGEMEERLNALLDERGSLRSELEALRAGNEHAQLLHQHEQQASALRQKAEQWAVLALCAALFQKAREIYERERQPAVLQRASQFFSAITQGRFQRIIAPIGQKRIVAVRADGEPMDTSRLSRGTAEQLYLAMRMAIALEYGKKFPLPLVMDDIFVNFDGDRLRQTLKVLGEVSKQHQILLFTCHAHVAKAVEEEIREVQRIEL